MSEQKSKIQESLVPIIKQLDKICERIKFMESIFALIHISRSDPNKPEITNELLSVFSKFICNECSEIYIEISGEIMDHLSLIIQSK